MICIVDCFLLCVCNKMILPPALYMIVVFVVVLSSVAWLFIGAMMKDLHFALRIVMMVVGVLALIIMPSRDLYLPFLGETALPAAVLPNTTPEGNVVIAIDGLPAHAKLVFWAANPSKVVGNTPQQAYAGGAPNGGVVTTTGEGIAHITLTCPQNYKVNRLGIDKILPKHVHFRYELPNKPGLFSPVLTKEISVAECQA